MRILQVRSQPLSPPFGSSLFAQSEIFPESTVEEFHTSVKQRVVAEIDGLVIEAVLKTKQLLQFGMREKNDMDSVLLREGYAQAERFASGVPAERFAKIVRKELRHKL